MNAMRMLERTLYGCPEIDISDTVRWPVLADQDYSYMAGIYAEDTSVVHIFPCVRRNGDFDPFIDIYIWDAVQQPETCRRFIIFPGYRMQEKAEDRFLELLRTVIRIEPAFGEVFVGDVRLLFPQWPLTTAALDHPGMMLEYLYFISHRSGAREILYKAKLEQIAWHLARIPDVNIIGTSPRTIIGHGLALKLLRILNHPDFIGMLFENDTIAKCRMVYKKYAGYITTKTISKGQWQYLESLSLEGGLFYGEQFSRTLYQRMKAPLSELDLTFYKEYLDLYKEMPQIRKWKLPKAGEVADMVMKLRRIRRYQEGNPVIDEMVRNRKDSAWYNYKDADYLVMMPESAFDICQEAVAQGNCLMDYVDAHAGGAATILFVRKAESPDESFVTMEIKDKVIEQVYGRFNQLPSREVYEFLEKYARIKWFYYDPYQLIMDRYDEIDPDEWDSDLLCYAEDYHERTQFRPFEWPDDGINYVQRTMWDIFPALM